MEKSFANAEINAYNECVNSCGQGGGAYREREREKERKGAEPLQENGLINDWIIINWNDQVGAIIVIGIINYAAGELQMQTAFHWIMLINEAC